MHAQIKLLSFRYLYTSDSDLDQNCLRSIALLLHFTFCGSCLGTGSSFIHPMQQAEHCITAFLKQRSSPAPLPPPPPPPTAASAQVAAVASHINEHIRQHEDFRRMLAIQNRLTGQCVPRILAPGRKYIQEGRVMKVARRAHSVGGSCGSKTRWSP